MAPSSPPTVGFFIDQWSALDNYSAHGIVWKGKRYPTVEHAYQAIRFLRVAPELADAIRRTSSPAAAKRLANCAEAQALEPADWASSKVAAMDALLREKLRQHPEIGELLCSSENAQLVETNDDDPFWGWGAGPAHAGENVMGALWMAIRRDHIASRAVAL